MRTFLRFISVFILLGSFVSEAHAAKRYWVAANDSIWNSTRNWSATSGGTSGASVPGSNDTAYFDNGSVKKDTFDINVSVKRIEISSAYTGTIIQGAKTFTIGTSGAVLSGGTFSGGSANITVSGAFTISGCAFTSSSGTFSTSANFTISSGSFTHNNGTLTLTATSTFTVSNTGGTTFYNLTFAPTAANATYTITSTTTITVSNTLSYGGNKTITLNTGTIHITGNISTASAGIFGGGGSAILRIDGTSNQSITGNSTGGNGRLPDVVINKSSGTLSLSAIISTVGNWTRTNGTISAGTSVMVFSGTLTITGTQTLNDAWFSPNGTYTIASGTTLTIAGKLAYGGGSGNCPVFNTGTIYAQGDIDLSNNTTAGGTGGSATIVINGSGTQTLTGSSTSSSGRLCHVQINKSPSDILNITDHITPMGDWTYTAGIIDPTTSEVLFTGTKTIAGSDSLYEVVFSGASAATYTIASGTILKVGGKLTINGTAAVTLNTGDIYAKGNISVTNTATTATGSASLTINGAGNQTLTGSGTAGQGRLPKITIDKTTGVLTLASVISVYGDWIYTKGSVAEGTSSVALYGTSNLDGQISGGSSLMRFYSLAVSADTRTLTGNIDVNKNFTIASGAILSAGSNSIYLAGNWNSSGTWTYGTGTVIFDSTGFKQITGASGAQVNFYNITFNKYYTLTSPSSLTLARPLKVNHTATFTQGHIKSTTTNYFEFALGATLSGGNDSAYVHGPVRKTGNDAFTFPLGDTALVDTAYHPLAMTAPSSTGDQFEATYFAQVQTLGDSLVDTLASLSEDEYWKFERKAGSSNVDITLGWNKNSFAADDPNVLRIADWNGVKWLDLGGASITANGYQGTVSTQVQPSFSSNITYLTFAKYKTSVPYAILKKKLDGGYYQDINGRLYFRFDEEYNDSDGKLHYNVYDSQNNIVSSDQIVPPSIQPIVSYGDNRYRMNTLHCQFSGSGSLPNGVYILEIINEKNEHWYLRFKQTTTISYSCFNPPIPQ